MGIRTAGRKRAWWAMPTLLGLAGPVCVLAATMARAEEPPSEEQLQSIIASLQEPEAEGRAAGLGAVRSGAPGKEATKALVALLPELSPEAQAELLAALRDRGDMAAVSAAYPMLNDREDGVRIAGLAVLRDLGDVADVPTLITEIASGSRPKRLAAEEALAGLRGDGIDQAIVAALPNTADDLCVVLSGVLVRRGAKEAKDAVPMMVACAEDAEPPVRLAALEVLRALADGEQAATLVELVAAAEDDEHRRKAELALLAVCRRDPEACVAAVVAVMPEADVPTRVVLLRALARAGGGEALSEVVARLGDTDQAVRDEAARMLSIWPDPAAQHHLRVLAREGNSLRHRVLAIRGLVRLAGPQGEQAADLQTLAEAMDLAERPEERRLVLGTLGGIPTGESLALAVRFLEDPELAEEAALATVMIAETMDSSGAAAASEALEVIVKTTKNDQIRGRAQSVLDPQQW